MNHRFVFFLLLVMAMVGVVNADTLITLVTHDGYVSDQSPGSWTTVRNAPGDTALDNPATVLWIDTVAQPAPDTNLWAPHTKAIISFNTSALPDGALLSSATVSVTGVGYGAWDGAGTINMSIIEAHPVNPMDYVAGDYAKTYFTRMATDIPYSSYNDVGYNNFTLTNLTTINKTGYTSFIVTHDGDTDARAMTWGDAVESYFELKSRTALSTASILTVVYTTVTAPVASFTCTKNFIRIPNSVTCTDTSTNTPTSWSWNMGDGSAAKTTQNVTYQYLKRGKWGITLNATNAGGSNVTPSGTNVRVAGYENYY